MNRDEGIAVWRIAAAGWPHQKFDEYTADWWAESIADLRLVDCRAALVNLSRRDGMHFVAPSDVRAEVKRIRARRIDDYGPIEPPPGLDPDNARAFIAWETAAKAAIADGDPPPKPAVLPARDMRQLEGSFPRRPR